MSDPQGEPNEPFYSVKSVHKMIESFNAMGLTSSEGMRLSSSEEKNLAEFQLELIKEDADLDLEKLIGYVKKVVSILLSYQNYSIACFGYHFYDDGNPSYRSLSSSLFVASILNMMGIACSKLKNYDEGLKYLKWAERNLPNLETDDASCCVDCCFVILHENQYQLYKVKRELYKLNFDVKMIRECPDHMKKILEIKKKTMDENHLELGGANMDVCSAYQLGCNFTEALPYLVKALEIYQRHFSSDSKKILQFRRFLSLMYSQVDDHEKALEQIQLCLENMDNDLELLNVMLEKGIYLVSAGRYDEDIGVIGNVVKHADASKMLLAKAFQYLALAYFHSRKFDDAIMYSHLESSSEILAKLEIISHDQLQQELFLENYDRLFMIIEQTCKRKQAISLLEDVLGKLKEKFGHKCLEVGYCYNVLGKTYLKSNILDIAAQNFARAKDVLDVRLGPSHLKTLTAHFCLAWTYANMRSFDLAIELQEKLIEHLKGLGPSQKRFLNIAIRELDQMKENKSSEEPSCSSRDPTNVLSVLTEMMKQGKSKRRGR